MPSESHDERALADLVEARLRDRARGLAVDRVGDNVVVRSELGSRRGASCSAATSTRCPANGNAHARAATATPCTGSGTADMKGGLAIMLTLAEALAAQPDAARFDATFVFYAGEEIAEEWNGLRDLFARAPELVAGDLAVLLEPTDGWVEAGCQGTLHVRATYRGARCAHRPPVDGDERDPPGGRRARRASPPADPGPVDVDGLEYRQALQAVRIEGGIANNVVPDECTLVVNRRFAPSVSRRARPRPRRGRSWPTPTRSRCSTRRSRRRPNLWDPLVAELVGTFDLGVRPEARLDRRRALRRARHPGAQLRARRPDARAHRRGAGDAGVARRLPRGARPVPRRGLGEERRWRSRRISGARSRSCGGTTARTA